MASRKRTDVPNFERMRNITNNISVKRYYANVNLLGRNVNTVKKNTNIQLTLVKTLVWK
jgi:hypothetical protein